MDKKIIFKNKELTRTKVKNNILHFYNMAESIHKIDWYKEALNFAIEETTKKHGYINNELLNISCGIIAALSPVKQWDQNKKEFINCLHGNKVGHMKQFIMKAENIKASKGTKAEILNILKGKKISSFFLNIRFPESIENVTIDRHAVSISLKYWINESEYKMTEKQYNFFKDCYIWTAQSLNISPMLLQSITWLIFRENKQLYKQ